MSFQARIRRLASETAIYGVSSIVGRLINFLLFPLYSHVFAPDEYGPVIAIYAAFLFLNILYQHGMESSYLKFASDRDELKERSSAFATALISLGAVSVLLSGLLLLAREPIGSLIGLESGYLYLLGYAAAILLLDSMAAVPFADLRLRNRPWVFASIRVINILVNVALNVILIFWMDMGIEAILIANVVASGVSLVLLMPTVIARVSTFDAGLWRSMMRFGLPFIPGGIGYAMTERLNIFFLERVDPDVILRMYSMSEQTHPDLFARAAESGPHVFSEHIVGTYGGIIKLAVLMALFVQMFRYAWQPFFLQHARDEDARKLFGRIFAVLTLVLLSAFLGISFLADELVRLPLPGGRTLIKSTYWMGLTIIPIALAGYVFQGWYYHFSAGAYLEDKSKYFLHATAAGAIVALTLNAVLVPEGGMWAAALATSSAYGVMAITLFVLIRKHYDVPYDWQRIGVSVLLAGIVFGAWYRVDALQVWWIEVLMVAGFAVISGAILRLLPLGRNP